MRVLIAALAAATLCATQVMAANIGPLPAGKPAGVKQAQGEDNTILYIVGAGAVIAGIVLVASNNGSDKPAATTATTSTSP